MGGGGGGKRKTGKRDGAVGGDVLIAKAGRRGKKGHVKIKLSDLKKNGKASPHDSPKKNKNRHARGGGER